MPGSVTVVDGSIVLTAHDGGFDAGKRAAHRTRTNIHRGVVRNHDAAGLGLPPVVVNRHAERFLSPHDRLGIERLADAGDETQMAKIVFANHVDADLHHHAHRGRRGIPDGDLLILQKRIPALGIEFGLVDYAGDAVGRAAR